MAKNRKSQSAANRFGPAIKALVICLLIGGSGIGYVWQKEQIIRLGQEIKRREVRRSALEDQNDKLRKQLGNIRSPAWIEARIKQLNLGLLPPQQAQVWRLPEPSTNSPAPAIPFSGKEYALHSRTPAGRR
jgi:uncharacterized protein YqjF (DUF2071 family)